MKNTKTPRQLLVVALVTMLAPAAWAQVGSTVNAATGPATHAAAHASAAAQRQAAAPVAATSAGVHAASQNAASAATRPVSGAGNGGIYAGANVNAERPLHNGVNASTNVTGHGAADVQNRGTAVSSAAHGAISASLSIAETTAQLRHTGADVRTAVLTTIDSRVDATEKSVDRLQRSARRLEGDIRDRADGAIDDVKDKEKAVRRSLKAARKAGAEEWSEARSTFAASCLG